MQFVKSFYLLLLQLLLLLLLLLLLWHVAVVLVNATAATSDRQVACNSCCRLTVSLNNLFEPFFSPVCGKHTQTHTYTHTYWLEILRANKACLELATCHYYLAFSLATLVVVVVVAFWLCGNNTLHAHKAEHWLLLVLLLLQFVAVAVACWPAAFWPCYQTNAGLSTTAYASLKPRLISIACSYN